MVVSQRAAASDVERCCASTQLPVTESFQAARGERTEGTTSGQRVISAIADQEEVSALMAYVQRKPRELKIYNAYDCVATARCYDHMVAEPEWKEPRVKRLYAVHRELARIAAEMNSYGVPISRRQRKWVKWALHQEYDEKRRLLIAKVGVKGFSDNPNHIRALIFKKHATGKNAHLGKFQLDDPIDPAMYVNPKDMTTISVDEDALTLLLIDPDTPKELKEIIQLYWDANSVWKAGSTFVWSKKVRNAIGTDWRLRAGWNSCGTDTGRFACKDPNLMNIPKLLRLMYVAEPGCVFVGADRMQFELRIMYAVTGDEALGAGIRAGNVYVEEAKDYFDLPKHFTKKDIKPEAYRDTKNIRLASQYGAGKKKRYQMLLKSDHTMTWEKANMLGNMFERRNATTVAWWDKITAEVHSKGYSETHILNRRRVYPRPPERTDTSNYPIQGTAGDVKDLWMIDVDKLLKKYKMKSRLVIDLHDALYTHGPKKESKDVEEIMQETSQVEYEICGKKYVFPVEAEVCKSWGDFH